METTLSLPALPGEAVLRAASLDDARRRLEELRAALATATQEAEAAKAEPARIAADIEAARRQRAEALARGLDLGSIGRSIKNLRDGQELAEDTAAGLELKRASLAEELETAEGEIKALEARIEFDRLALAVARYTVLAEALAPVLAEILTRRGTQYSAGFKGGVDVNSRHGGWEHSCFECIPRLYLTGQERPPYDADSNFHFRERAGGGLIVFGRFLRRWWNPDTEPLADALEPVVPAEPVYPEESHAETK